VHRLMQRPVALKVIHPHLLEHPMAVERFRREVQAAARLVHPNIVTAFDAEQAGSLHFLVMEYVEGISLAQLVHQRGRLRVQLACDYVRQAAVGLEHAMEQGMVHRDVKPQNLMLTAGGVVKILDFGLARLARHDEPAPSAADAGSIAHAHPALTAASSMLGTLEYMAPEQAESAAGVDIRADIYSLGRTLEFLLTGTASHATGATGPATVDRPEIAGPKTGTVPSIPRRLAAILARMTAPDPEDRYRTPADVAEALKPWVAPARGFRLRRAVPVGLGAILLALVGVWAVTGGRATTTRPSAVAEANPRQPPASSSPAAMRAASQPAASAAIDRRRLLVILPEEFEPDVYKPFALATRERFKLEVASTSARPCRPVAWQPGRSEFPPQHDLSAGPLDAAGYAGVVLVGGNIYLYKHADAPLAKTVWKLVTDARAGGLPVVALGQGIRVLAAIDEFRDTRLALGDEQYRTMFPAHRQWSDQPMVADGRILTASRSEGVETLVERLDELVSGSSPPHRSK